MLILNLGCGVKTSPSANIVNIDWSPFLQLRRSPILRRLAPVILGRQRRDAFLKLSPNILVHDLSRGIPFPTETIDAVYHSHLLEHIDRDKAPMFMAEIWRVLKCGGIHRVAVPDFERVCRLYLDHVQICGSPQAEPSEHEYYIGAILEQSVRREGSITSKQSPLRRLLENRILGDARRRGETHQWMYDKITLRHLLETAGFHSPTVSRCNSSKIDGWSDYGLETDLNGSEYKPGSLYVEGLK